MIILLFTERQLFTSQRTGTLKSVHVDIQEGDHGLFSKKTSDCRKISGFRGIQSDSFMTHDLTHDVDTQVCVLDEDVVNLRF